MEFTVQMISRYGLEDGINIISCVDRSLYNAGKGVETKTASIMVGPKIIFTMARVLHYKPIAYT